MLERASAGAAAGGLTVFNAAGAAALTSGEEMSHTCPSGHDGAVVEEEARDGPNTLVPSLQVSPHCAPYGSASAAASPCPPPRGGHVRLARRRLAPSRVGSRVRYMTVSSEDMCHREFVGEDGVP